MITLSSLNSPYLLPARATAQSNSDPISEPQPRKIKPSSQLKNWSIARALRSGRKLGRPNHRNRVAEIITPVQQPIETEIKDSTPPARERDNEIVEWTNAKSIYIISDGTGWTAEHAVNAALGQFDYCLVDRGCPVNTHLFSGIDDEEKLLQIIKQAAKESALVLYTLADPSMSESAKQACTLWGIPSTDILGPITDSISTHLGVSPSGLPRGAGRTAPLSEDYFKRIEAMEFTIKQDDGALPENLPKADIVLAGVSRSGKTPLSIYLAQKGYKTANVPIVMGIKLPETLFTVDPEKVFGLTINPSVLQAIRRSRVKTLGFTRESRSNYSEMDHVKQELEHARKVFAQNPKWPVIEVTGKAIEETAAIILRLYHDRKNKYKMPAISKRY